MRARWFIMMLLACLVGGGCAEHTGSSGNTGVVVTPPGIDLPAFIPAVQQTNLVADLSAQATTTDPNLVNPWGVALDLTGTFWVADNGTGLASSYDASGRAQPTVITIPPPSGSPPDTIAAPTGVVFNFGGGFATNALIFATEDGTISAWNPRLNPTAAVLQVDNSASGAVYKGLAIGTNIRGDHLLFATDFRNNRIDVFDTNFAPTTLRGNLTDTVLPSGFAPFGIVNIGGLLLVSYARQDPQRHDDTPGLGNGVVDIFDMDGKLVQRFASLSPLNSPWGMAVVPGGFGAIGNTILVGNFGDGHINVFSPQGVFLGQLQSNQQPLTVDGLWGLIFASSSQLFFTAGPNHEQNGLFGSLQVI